MRYIWDERKRLENIRKHGIDFVGCDAVFAGWTLTVEDDRYPYEEQRYITAGMLEDRIVVIAHTEIDDVIRIISIRKATRHEQKRFFQISSFPIAPD